MAIFKQSTFSLVLVALISSTAYGNINFMQCDPDEGTDAANVRSTSGGTFNNGLEGNERTTYGNLCGGTAPFSQNGVRSDNKDIDSRVGHSFARFCDLIDRWTAVQNLMFRGQSPHTVFAPTDAAFSKVDGLLTRVNELRLLELHILPQARLTQDLRCGQTYRTINTLQDRRNNQRSKTRCVNAGTSQQLGPGNTINGLRPTIGQPPNMFKTAEFTSQDEFVVNVNDNQNDANDKETFSQNVMACNGIIHVVDEILLPGNINDFSTAGVAYGGYSGLAYGGSYYNGEPHAHQSYYGAAPAYYNGVNSAVYYGSVYYGKGSKGGKGYSRGGRGRGKGGKGYGYNRRSGPRPRPYYYGNYYNRNLKAGEKGSDEKPMSDAEFFGTGGLADIEAKIESVKDEFAEKPDENRKRRLEAMLEPDGSIKV